MSRTSAVALTARHANPTGKVVLQPFSKKLNFRVVPDIPEFFYLRKMTLSVKSPNGKRTKITLYVFCNYSGTIRGTVLATQRHLAKRALRKEYPAIQFYR